MKKAALIMADGCEEGEALTIIDIFRRASIQCDLTGLDSETVTGSHDVTIKMDRVLCDDIKDYDMLILPGGYKSAEAMCNNELLISVIKEMYTKGKYIGAICAAPIVLDKAGILSGQSFTCYPSISEKISNGKLVSDRVHVCKNLITSQGPATAYAFAYTLIDIMEGDSLSLKNKMLYYNAFNEDAEATVTSLPDASYKSSSKKAAVLLGNGFEESETIQIIDLLRRAGISVSSFATSGEEYVLSMNGVYIRADKKMSDEIMDYDIVIVPGGKTASDFISDKRVTNCLKIFDKGGKLIAGMCSGTSVLHAAGLLAGKTVTGYTGYDKKLTGTDFVDDVVVRDSNIITSQGPATPYPFAFCIIEALGVDPAPLKERLLYRLAGGK